MIPTKNKVALSLGVLASLLTAGCEVPQGAAMQRQILAGAEDPAADFALVKVNRDTLPMVSRWAPPPSHMVSAGWLPASRGIREEMIAAGDRLDVTMWSNEENGLLSVPGQKLTQLPQLKVSRDGTLFLPYAGEVAVAGLSLDAARQKIQDKLATIAPSAQVTLAHAAGRDNSVQVVGGLSRNGVVGLPDRDFTVLDAIAASDGIPGGVPNPQVNVMRGGKLYAIAFSDLLQDPGRDALMRPGDRLYVQPEQRYFMTLGAAQRETQIPFPRTDVSVLDAVSLMGGLMDQAADPKAVLILRNYPQSAVREDTSGPSRQRMIFAFDLISADGLFSAGDFQIEDRDVVLVAQSPLLTDSAILNFLSRLTGLGLDFTNFQLKQQAL